MESIIYNIKFFLKVAGAVFASYMGGEENEDQKDNQTNTVIEYKQSEPEQDLTNIDTVTIDSIQVNEAYKINKKVKGKYV